MTPRTPTPARLAPATSRRRLLPDIDRPDLSFEPVVLRARHDGWTPQRQNDFIQALAASGCVSDAAKSVGMSATTAYELRQRFDAQPFRLAWDAALDYAIRRLSDVAYSRAIYGDVIPHYYKGELVGEHRRYDSALTRFLLRYRDPLHYGRDLDKKEYCGTDEFMAVRLASALLDVEIGEGRIERINRQQREYKEAADAEKAAEARELSEELGEDFSEDFGEGEGDAP